MNELFVLINCSDIWTAFWVNNSRKKFEQDVLGVLETLRESILEIRSTVKFRATVDHHDDIPQKLRSIESSIRELKRDLDASNDGKK